MDILIAILGLGFLIFVHELGHFMAARGVGIGVHRFSIGFGPATPIHFRRGKTEYLVAWIPLGGYVKMASHEEQQEMETLEGGAVEEVFPDDELFENKPLWARILVLSAGVLMNILTAWIIYVGIAAGYGRSELATTTVAEVAAETLPEGASALASLPAGSQITAVGDTTIDTWNTMVRAVLDSPAGPTTLRFANNPAVTVDLGDESERRALAGSLVPRMPAKVGEVAPGRAADRAGLESGDRIVAIDGQPTPSWAALVDMLKGAPGQELQLSVERLVDGQIKSLEIAITPETHDVKDPETGETRQEGKIGIGADPDTIRIPLSFGEALNEGTQRTWFTAGQIVGVLKGLFQREVSPRDLGGPIAIVQISGQASRAGLEIFLAFLAFLSVNLAVLNLLPIPALDGGHLIFLFAEGLRGGKPLPLEWRHRLLNIGVLMLLALMVFVFGNDILRILGW